jgi:hypothetical protein
MTRQRWIYKADGRVIDCSVEQDETPERRGVTIMPDLPDFISPIDRTVVRGRAGMREHCKKHDVVPTADLAGLPTERPKTLPDRGAIREELRRQLYK